MATGTGAVAPTPFNANQRPIDLAPVGSTNDSLTKQQLSTIGVSPLPLTTLQGSGQGIYADVTA